MLKHFLKMGVLPLLILAIGGVFFVFLIWIGDPPPRIEKTYPGPLVKAIAAPQKTVAVVVDGSGPVRPGAQVDLVPQVTGVVVWKSAQLEPGGFFDKGDVLFRIEAEDYELAVARAEAQVAQAEYRLDLMRQEAAVARQEWHRMQASQQLAQNAAPTPLVLQEPQLRAAQAAYDAARAQVLEARLHLRRTQIKAPFAGRVEQAFADVGQFVSAGRPVGRLYSIESAEIVVPVPNEDLAWFDLEALRTGDATAWPKATITGAFAGREQTWHGRLVRIEAALDAQSRMAHLIVNVPDPYGLHGRLEAPLMAGLYASVRIEGKTLSGVRLLPHAALREDDVVWAVGADHVLRICSVRIVRDQADGVLGIVALADDERVIVSQLSGVTDGMRVRVAEGAGP